MSNKGDWDNLTPAERQSMFAVHTWAKTLRLPLLVMSTAVPLVFVYLSVRAIAGTHTVFDVGISISIAINIAIAGVAAYYYRQWQQEKKLRIQLEKKPATSKRGRAPSTRRRSKPS